MYDTINEQIRDLQNEITRLKGVLAAIDGGDNPCFDENVLRQWAYEGLTLGKDADQLSSPDKVRRMK